MHDANTTPGKAIFNKQTLSVSQCFLQ